MRIQNLLLTITALAIAFTFTGCYYDTEEELYGGSNSICDTSNVTYSATIDPMMKIHCTNCHSRSAPPLGVDLTTYAGVYKAAITTNKLYGCVAQLDGFKKMPTSYKLSNCDILKVKNWVDKGAPQN